jgi:hypothetical protein
MVLALSYLIIQGYLCGASAVFLANAFTLSFKRYINFDPACQTVKEMI